MNLYTCSIQHQFRSLITVHHIIAMLESRTIDILNTRLDDNLGAFSTREESAVDACPL